MSIASRILQDRALAVALVVVGLGGLGALALDDDGVAPAPCAAPARDGDALRCDGKGTAPGARAWLAGQKLDLNRASVSELSLLPRLGRKRARDIVAARTARGGFTSVDALLDIKGIGPKTVEVLGPLVEIRP